MAESKKFLAILGSRNLPSYFTYEDFKKVVEQFNKDYFNSSLTTSELFIVSGGARGIDKYAERLAAEYSLAIEVIKPQWHTYGKSAGFIRNTSIVEKADYVLAIWDEKSRGTADSIKKALSAKKPVVIYSLERNHFLETYDPRTLH